MQHDPQNPLEIAMRHVAEQAREDGDEDDFFNGETYDGTRGLARDYDNLPAGYDRDAQAHTGRSDRWIGPFFGEHMLGPHARRPPGVPPHGWRRAEERIYEDVCERLGASVQLDPRDIEVRVERGEVTLAGTVSDRRQKRIAEHIALSVLGVDDVHNELRIAAPPVT